jgi:phosphoglycolate phosphatase
MKAVKWVLFDFDGTISDSHDAAVQTYNDLSGRFGYRLVDAEELDELRNHTSREILKTLGISIFKLPFVIRAARTRFESRIDSLRPIQGMQDALGRLTRQGLKIGILTSNSNENVLKFLKKNNLEIFDFVSTGASVFGKGRTIRKLLKDHGIHTDEAVYVGDETRDIDAAKFAGIRMVSVTWGFNTRQALQNQNPDFLIDDPLELPSLFG